MFSKFFLFFVNFQVDGLLMGLDFLYFYMISLLPYFICFHIFFDLKMASF